jgi:hypothetical protein
MFKIAHTAAIPDVWFLKESLSIALLPCAGAYFRVSRRLQEVPMAGGQTGRLGSSNGPGAVSPRPEIRTWGTQHWPTTIASLVVGGAFFAL